MYMCLNKDQQTVEVFNFSIHDTVSGYPSDSLYVNHGDYINGSHDVI